MCVENACRSQLAESITNAKFGDYLKAFSAGSNPAKEINPKAIKSLERKGIFLKKKKPKHVLEFEGQDFDFEYNIEIPKGVDLVTGFEILEHLVSPFPLLKNLNCKRLFVTVPLNLWFSKAYKNTNDERDRHYHEFEAWQFDWLLEKSGWEVKKKDYWKNPTFKLGIRPLLRN